MPSLLALLQAGLLAAICCAAAPSTKWGATATGNGQFSWFNAQSHGSRTPADSNGDGKRAKCTRARLLGRWLGCWTHNAFA